ncbi:hypothetical protein CLPUN_35160 [Clostridium puniceum]|uniref:Uncharacterized protein n=1 Tax=Clostridium puniceum TaxID=29367 RepID=A0A1S8TBT6_9CLOT|nr:hypothetical protein CLPUN_35160 [Clostridium puniceum]
MFKRESSPFPTIIAMSSYLIVSRFTDWFMVLNLL